MQHKTEKQNMKKKIEQKWIKRSKKANKLSEEEAEFEEDEEVEREVGFSSTLFESFSA